MTRDELLAELETCIGVLTLQSLSASRLDAWRSLLADAEAGAAARAVLQTATITRGRCVVCGNPAVEWKRPPRDILTFNFMCLGHALERIVNTLLEAADDPR